ncbi:MAG: chromosomal replication initiator protein DnaA [Eubacteriales bacterium]|jgi:chromosomal replication initiator protein|nr:chromosomal replication initiator protein DnaA [Eubacteriales bacterium]
MQSYIDIWRRVMEELGKSLSQTQIGLWFEDMTIKELTDSDVYLVNKSDFKRDIIEKKYKTKLAETLEEILGFAVEIHIISKEHSYIYDSEADDQQLTDTDKKESARSKKTDDLFSAVQSKPKANENHVAPGSQYTFDNFIVGNSNKFAHAASLAVAENPASEYNPLFIYGASGLGKTHLLCAIINQIKQINAFANLIYVKGDDFTNQMIDSIRHESTAAFRERYRRADVLLIDDIQFIAGKEGTQEEFFHTFNALYEDHRQIIMTSDRPPRDIKTLEDRLKTRFEWGLIADVQPPDFELRIAIMKNKAELLKIKMPDDVIVFLAENLKSNVRQLEGAIKKLGAQSLLTGIPINVDLAITCVADLLTGSEPVSVTVERILDKVSHKYNIPIETIKSRKRTKDVAYARHITIFIIRRLTDMSLPAIGKYMGRDHTTILNSLDTIENEMKTSATLELEINELIKEIKENSR